MSAFEIVSALGSQEIKWEEPMSNVSVTRGQCLYWSSGYLKNDFASVTCALLAGISQDTIDNSGGSAGDYDMLFEPSPLVIYDVGTADTATAATRGNNVALASATTLTSLSNGTDITGVFKIMKFISSSKVRGRLNFTGEADT